MVTRSSVSVVEACEVCWSSAWETIELTTLSTSSSISWVRLVAATGVVVAVLVVGAVVASGDVDELLSSSSS